MLRWWSTAGETSKRDRLPPAVQCECGSAEISAASQHRPLGQLGRSADRRALPHRPSHRVGPVRVDRMATSVALASEPTATAIFTSAIAASTLTIRQAAVSVSASMFT
jgi:hypothetical protein